MTFLFPRQIEDLIQDVRSKLSSLYVETCHIKTSIKVNEFNKKQYFKRQK